MDDKTVTKLVKEINNRVRKLNDENIDVLVDETFIEEPVHAQKTYQGGTE